ncbi:DNA-processing protein DprA [Bacillus cereus]|nr:DNA-processing protein DprA [Bacillus cereus]
MQFTNNEISTYLFCAQLSQTKTTPLTILEWNAVVKSLGEHKLQPEALLTMTSSELLNALTQATVAQKSKILKKVEARQKLGISMLELEEIVHQGYGIMFRSHMPKRIKKLTQKFVPAFFYYAGDPSILSYHALGVVGARGANTDELTQTANITREAAGHGVVIISGGAKGIDTMAVETALQHGGKAVVFPADGLEKWVKKSTIRQYIINGQLLLMSNQRLNAPFSGSYAMQRNKFIHAPSDAVLVASSKISGTKSSGTWEGVLENLKQQWSPLYGIGDSEGVVQLIVEGYAKAFSSFEEIYQSTMAVKKSNEASLQAKLADLIQLAVTEGMDREMIEKMFVKALGQHFKQKMRCVEEDSLQELQKSKEIEQLSITELLNGDVK